MISSFEEYLDVYKDNATEFSPYDFNVLTAGLELDATNNEYTWYTGGTATTFTTKKDHGQSIKSIELFGSAGFFWNFGKYICIMGLYRFIARYIILYLGCHISVKFTL